MGDAERPRLITRRRFIQAAGAMGLLRAWSGLVPAFAQTASIRSAELRVGGDYVGELFITRAPFEFGGRRGSAVTINGTVPGPLLRFREGETVTLQVTNRLEEPTSVHWHGLLVPSDMDGVPGISFPGIAPGETFTYRYPVRQSGTYWYHSHSAFQEQLGHYAPLVIDPAQPDPVAYDREHIVMFSDWTFELPARIFSKLKKQSDFYNFQQRTAGDLFRDAKRYGLGAAAKDRLMWAQMRMSPADILDITGYTYTYLVNGMPPELNWTGLFEPGERVRLRFINAAASTFFNVRIPGLPMTVVQADGQNVEPVTVEEFQMGVAETYDVIVQPVEERAFTVFAEALDRSGYARGTLAPWAGMSAEVPALRKRPLRSMADMGMDMKGIDHGAMSMGGGGTGHQPMSQEQGGGQATGAPGGHEMSVDSTSSSMAGHAETHPMPDMGPGRMKLGDEHARMQHEKPPEGEMTPMRGMRSPVVARHGPGTHGPGNTMVAEVQRNRLGEPGTGLEVSAARRPRGISAFAIPDGPRGRRPRSGALLVRGRGDRLPERRGYVETRIEAEYDILLTQRLILQPRFETGFATSGERERGIGQGFDAVELGMRLRYEITRHFAPYIGISWSRKLGETADFARNQDEDVSETAFVAGVRMWF